VEGAVVTCIVTIHGIGFQTPPDDARRVAGYADALHAHLKRELGPEMLGDDPERGSSVKGPVYVHSNWPPGAPSLEPGISRLGQWVQGAEPRQVTSNRRLVDADQSVAHVALVYANLEGK
jgi:hypothetical protein